MASPNGERAIADALQTGNAILKFISANDVDLTGAHQRGFYLPKRIWKMFTDMPPQKGKLDERPVKIIWQDDRETDSRIHWYGSESRSEYRLTRFGRDFPFRTFDNLGDLLVLIPQAGNMFHAYVLDQDEDIEEIQVALGVEVIKSWGAYRAGHEEATETPDECVERQFREFMKPLNNFPSTLAFSSAAREALQHCMKTFEMLGVDQRLMELIEKEYRLFRMVERQVCQKEIIRPFRDVDDFLTTAQSIANRRKSRAGRSLENHVGWLLKDSGVIFDPRARIDGKVEPDILIPSKAAYDDPSFPVENLCIIGIKTTCKDRWRQVLNEGKRVAHKHILTLQPGISANQLLEMKEANISLIVPEALHGEYPKNTGMPILTVGQFIAGIKHQQGSSASMQTGKKL